MTSVCEGEFYCPVCRSEIPLSVLNRGWTVPGVGGVSLTGSYVAVVRRMACPDCGTRLNLTSSFLWDYNLESIEAEVVEEVEP